MTESGTLPEALRRRLPPPAAPTPPPRAARSRNDRGRESLRPCTLASTPCTGCIPANSVCITFRFCLTFDEP